jgi:uncharacterized protein with GYD domain
MDTYVVLMRYTSEGRKFATPVHARKRWTTIETSLKNTLRGEVLSHYVTMGAYDSVVTFRIPTDDPERDFALFQCLIYLQVPGDIEVTVLRAWEFNQFAPVAPQAS